MEGKTRAYVLDLTGGIGDIFYGIWVDGKFANLDDLKDSEYAVVVNKCRTPGVEELFKWHPKKGQIEVLDLSRHPTELPQEERKALGIPDVTPHIPPLHEPRFYPSPEDLKVLASLPTQPYIVFALSGSFIEKNFPSFLANKAASVVLGNGYRIVVVGKTYKKRIPTGQDIIYADRLEERLADRPGITDLIDRLTLPGTCALVGTATAVVCCDSAIMHLSLRMGKPTFIAIPDQWFDYWISVDSASWGKYEIKTTYTKTSQYRDGLVVEWMKKNKIWRDPA